MFYKNLLESDFILFKKFDIQEEYDLFCAQQKHKQLVQAQNNLILLLNSEHILNIDINDYFNFILQHMQKAIDSQDVYHLDLILSLLLDITTRTKEKINFFNHFQVIANLRRILDTPPNKKITFICENILNMYS
jgi:hypothetical protein